MTNQPVMKITNRPAEHYIHGDQVLVPSWAAAFLYQVGNFEKYTAENRGRYPHADSVLVALRVSGQKWRAGLEGTTQTEEGERAPRLEWLTTRQLADALSFTVRGARKACSEGRVEAELVDGRYRISRTALAHYRAKHHSN